MTTIYFDHAAATPLHPAVLEKMMPCLTMHFGNPSSLHAYGRTARAVIDKARDSLAKSLNCDGKQLVFTSGGTESNNLAILGSAIMSGKGKHVITTQVEHYAVLHSCKQLEEMGYSVTYLPVDSTGLVRIEDLEANIRPDTVLISIIAGNNEVGTIQPILTLGNFARSRGILFHVDAVQAFGVLDLDLAALPVDLMSFSAHKIQGPKGIGGLYCSPKVRLAPQMLGGSQERMRRAGTENVAGIVGFAEAARLVVQNISSKQNHMQVLRTSMIDLLARQVGTEHFVVNGHPLHCLPHILNLSFPDVHTETMLISLDLEGIAVASGSACTSGSLEVSHVLRAMSLPDEITRSAIRISFGNQNTVEETQYVANVIATIVSRIRTK